MKVRVRGWTPIHIHTVFVFCFVILLLPPFSAHCFLFAIFPFQSPPSLFNYFPPSKTKTTATKALSLWVDMIGGRPAKVAAAPARGVAEVAAVVVEALAAVVDMIGRSVVDSTGTARDRTAEATDTRITRGARGGDLAVGAVADAAAA